MHFTVKLSEDQEVELSRETVRKLRRRAGIEPKRRLLLYPLPLFTNRLCYWDQDHRLSRRYGLSHRACIGVFFISAGLEGYLVRQLSNWQRIGMTLGGAMLIDPRIFTDLIGGGLIVISLLGDIRELIHRE